MLITIKFSQDFIMWKKLFLNKKATIKDNKIIFKYIDFNGEIKTREYELKDIEEITFED